MPGKTPISEIMTTSVRTLDVDAKLSEARRLLREEDVHHAPVVEGDKLVGIISSSDLVRIYRKAARSHRGELDEILDGASNVAAAMSTDLVTLESDETIERAIDLVADGSVHSVLVVDEGGRMAGIVTVADLLDYLGG